MIISPNGELRRATGSGAGRIAPNMTGMVARMGMVSWTGANAKKKKVHAE
ncbi:hypothetical protein N9189_02235 [Pirellulaceae bacterium]|nr:hypothetical protein [Pirellulaceae bacterium]